MKSLDDRLHALVRRTAGALAVEVKALIAAQVRAAADTIAPPPERQGDDALKVTLPNGITVQTESQGDVEALIGWLGMAPAVVLEQPSLPVSPPSSAVAKDEVVTDDEVFLAPPSPVPVQLGFYTLGKRISARRWLYTCSRCGSSVVMTEREARAHARGNTMPLGLCKPECWELLRHEAQPGELTKSPKMGSDSPIREVVSNPAPAPANGKSGAKYSENIQPTLEAVSPSNEAPKSATPAPERPAAKPKAAPASRLSGFATLMGQVFGTWLVIERAPSSGANSRWACKCLTCGAIKEHYGFMLRRKPAGCLACRKAGKAPAKPESPARAHIPHDDDDDELNSRPSEPPASDDLDDVDDDLLERAMAEMAVDKADRKGWHTAGARLSGGSTRDPLDSEPPPARDDEEREDEDEDEDEEAAG